MLPVSKTAGEPYSCKGAMSCRAFCVMLASMPAGTNSTVAIEGKQLLLTIGPAGVLSSRAIVTEDLAALFHLLGPLSERQRRDFRRLTDIVLIENGATISGRARASCFRLPTRPTRWL